MTPEHLEATDRLREAAEAIYRRWAGSTSPGSQWEPGHDVVVAEWDALGVALGLARVEREDGGK